MYDKYMIDEKEFMNVWENGMVTGFQLGVRLPYYRGLGLSMVEDIGITVDAETYPRNLLQVTLHGNTYTLNEMENQMEDRWEFGEVGTLVVQKPGGLQPGVHTIELMEQMRISYRPVPLVGRDTKILLLEAF